MANLSDRRLKSDPSALWVDPVNHRVGIGTTNPGSSFDVYGTSNVSTTVLTAGTSNVGYSTWKGSGDPLIQIGQWSASATGISFGLTHANLAFLTTTTASSVHPSALVIGSYGGTPLVFATNATETMRIAANGYVGIGTTNPQQKFHVHNGFGLINGLSGAEVFSVQTTNNSSSSKTFQVYSGNADPEVFQVRANGAIRMVTTNWSTGGTAIGISSNLLTTSPSSIRYKKNIVSLTVQSEKIYDLKPVEFDYIADDRHSFGYIAEEAEKYLPCVVNKEPKGENGEMIPESIAYDHLPVLIIEEMKKLKDELKTAKYEIELLKNK